ncbi:hypothetical protein BH20ACT18_BH20ACT18_06900 [soil metagenome]
MMNRLIDRLLLICLRAYPRTHRERDGEVLLSLAHELHAGGSSPWREGAGLVRGGVAERLRLRCRVLVGAPWRAALARLALPLAAVSLAVWVAGVGSVDPVPTPRALVPLSDAALPAVWIWLFARFAGPAGTEVGSLLVAALFVLAAFVVIWCALRRRHDPVGATLSAIVLAIAAPAGVVLLPSLLPYDGAWDGVGIAALVAAGVLAPIACAALVGCGSAGSTSV